MSELRKIVRQRLAAGQRPGNQHPDADLLAALAEQRLSGAERDRVLAHLAQCAECREVAVMAAPREEPTQTVVRPVRKRWWLLQPNVVRWGSAAAVVAVIAVAASLYMSKGKMPAAQRAATYTELSQAASKQAPAAEVEAKPKEMARAAVAEKRQAEPGKLKDKADFDGIATKEMKKDETREQPARVAGAISGGAEAGQSMAKAEVPAVASSAEEVTVNNAPSAAADSRTNVAQSAPAPVAAPKTGSASNETVSAASSEMASAAPVPREMLAQRMAKVTAASVRWSVSSGGRVQMSKDGGRNWSQLAVAKDVHFLAVSAMGGDVWAGGSGGALFHSADFGQTWRRVAVGTDEDIARVDFRDAQHGTVITAAGGEWTTEDGGKNWRSQK